MREEEEDIAGVLRRMHAGEDGVVEELMARIRPWLSDIIRPQLRGPVRAKIETEDVVQDALVEFLRYAPRFVVHSEAEFRAFMRRVAKYVVRGHRRYFERQRRRLSRERPLTGATNAVFDTATPSKVASKDEEEARVRLALEMVDPLERRILCMRVYDRCTFRKIADELAMNEDAVRKRLERVMPKLREKVECLERGDVWAFLDDERVERPKT